MVCITRSQNVNLRGSAPIERPKYTNDTFPTLQFEIVAASTNHDSKIFTPINILLLKLTFRPDIASNNKSLTRKALTLAQLFNSQQIEYHQQTEGVKSPKGYAPLLYTPQTNLHSLSQKS